jgi:hypothetical protein
MPTSIDTSQLVAGLKAAKAKLIPSLIDAVTAEYQTELEEAQARCPVDMTPAPKHPRGGKPKHPGALRDSAKLQVTQEGSQIVAILSFGGSTPDYDIFVGYAVFVHENLEAHHEVGQAKFLESVLDESASSMMGRIGARVKL